MIKLGPEAIGSYAKAVAFGAFVLVCIPIAICVFPLWCVGAGAFAIEAWWNKEDK